MQRPTVLLGGALALQLALALALSLGGSGNGAFKAKEPLLTFDGSAIDRIDIDESGANSVTLAKVDGKWTLPSSADFPADTDKVANLLSKLADLKKGWPVATSSEAATRFKVTDDSHERRIVLKKGDKTVAELLVGSSPSFRQAYARSSDGSSVYNVAFSTYEAGDRSEDWMYQSLLNLSEDQVASISVGDVTLEQKDHAFVLQKLAEGETAKESQISRLVSAVTHPIFDAVQGKGADALAKVNEPDVEVAIKLKNGTSFTTRYKKEAAGGAYLFSRSGSDYLFRVAETTAEPIVKAKHETLVDTKKKEGEGVQAETKPQEEHGSGG